MQNMEIDAGEDKGGVSRPVKICAVLIVGDSNADYWDREENCGTGGNCAQDIFNKSHNTGIGGGTITGVLGFVPELKEQTTADLAWVVMVAGGNDMIYGGGCGFVPGSEGLSPAEVFAVWKDVIGKLGSGWKSGTIPRIMMISMGREPGTAAFHSLLDEYDTLMKAHVKELAATSPATPPVLFVDMAGVFDAAGNGLDLYVEDEYHLSPKGYGVWNTAVLAAMEGPRNCIIWGGDNKCADPAASSLVEAIV